MSKYNQYTAGDILVEPYKFISILDFNLIREMNTHTKMIISGIIDESLEDEYVEFANEDTIINVSVKDENNNIKTLFEGIISNIEISVNNKIRELKIEAISNTFVMDLEKKSRSFQTDSYTYAEIFKIINSGYNDAQISEDILNNKTIDKMIVQYNETDWEFIKRLGSHFNAYVIVESQLPHIKYSLGTSTVDRVFELEEEEFKIKKDLNEFRSLEDEIELNDINSICYEVRSNKILNLGNEVKFQTREYFVFRSEVKLEQGVLNNYYILKDKKGMKIKKYYNNGLIGASLKGTILNTKNDVVQVNLDIDGKSSNRNLWFPYSTVYSSEDGTGWYCMPEIGDAVRVYFPDNDEKNAYAISSVNTKSTNSSKRSDPSVKSIGTKYGKEVVMKDGAVEIIGNGNLLMRMTDDGGIEIKSDKKIIFDAKEEIEITGGASISIEGKKSVDLLQGNANLKIKDDVKLTGGKVNIE